jgi:hypothetical protein
VYFVFGTLMRLSRLSQRTRARYRKRQPITCLPAEKTSGLNIAITQRDRKTQMRFGPRSSHSSTTHSKQRWTESSNPSGNKTSQASLTYRYFVTYVRTHRIVRLISLQAKFRTRRGTKILMFKILYRHTVASILCITVF